MRIDLKYAQCINESRRLNEGLSPDGKTFEVYHRTGSDIGGADVNALVDRVQSIVKNGFRSGMGAMYGRGFYSTGDFESQFGMRYQKYGNMAGNYCMAIIKYQVPTKGLFVFDYRLAKKIYGGNAYTLADQYHKIAPNKPIPRVIEVLSDDLEQTLVNPKLSADRAYAFWGRFLYQGNGKPGATFWCNYDIAPPSAVLNTYEALTKDDYKNCDIYRLAGSTGIAYAGNSDGNAVFIKDDSTGILKPLMYCIMDYTKPTDKKAFVVPWTKVGSAAVAGATGAGCLVDILSAAGVPRSGNSFASVYAEGYPKNGNTAAIDFIKQDFQWTVSPLCHFKKLVVAFCKGKRDYIFDGTWDRGKCTVHFFGKYLQLPVSEQSVLKATGFDGKSLASDVFIMPEFRGGEMECDIFAGGMYGGVFRRGSFQGFFKGGVIDFDGKVDYQATYFDPTSTSSCAIKYGGKIYKIGNTPPNVYLANLKSGTGTTSSAIAGTLADTIKASLAFDVNDFRIADNWRKAASIAQGFAAFKKTYPYLFAKVGGALWYVPPLIRVTDDKIICESGTLSGRAIYFDVWGKDASVVSGIVKRSNGLSSITEFNGTFNGGIFEGGVFNGIFNGGILNVDLTVWGNSAKWMAGSNPKFMHSGKVMALDPRALLLPDANGNLKYPTIQDIIAGVKSGEIMKDLKKFDMFGKACKAKGIAAPRACSHVCAQE